MANKISTAKLGLFIFIGVAILVIGVFLIGERMPFLVLLLSQKHISKI